MNACQQKFQTDSVQIFRMVKSMEPVGNRLKQLRLSAVPPLSIRQIADRLGMGHSSYNFYESSKTYKKPFLPIEFTRKVATLLSEYGVDPAEVMKLAGLSDQEAEPEAKVIEEALPAAQYVSVSMLFPSEVALTDMFETLLSIVPQDATRREAAQILARLLPAGFAAIGPVAPDKAVEHPPFPFGTAPFDQENAETKLA